MNAKSRYRNVGSWKLCGLLLIPSVVWFEGAASCAAQTPEQSRTQTQTQTQTPEFAAELGRIAEFLSGTFSSREQSQKDRAFFDVRLTITPIWKDITDKTGEHWLYVEQAMADTLDKPYRQRVYQIVRRDGGSVSVVYTLPGDPLRFAGAGDKPLRLAGLSQKDLIERKGCAILLKKADGDTKDGRPTGYVGSTADKGCASDLRGASYATSEVTLTADTLTSWDRGYDASGKQVWGAVKGPYIFKKTTKPRKTPASARP